MAVIAIYSVKGGVGKTTLAANLAWCSATISCRRTLLWDLDPAGGAGFLLGDDTGSTRSADGKGAGHIFADGDPDRLIRRTAWDRLDLLPADESLRDLDALFATLGKRKRLAKLTAALAGRYDRIILDCPPVLGEVAGQILRATDLLVLPLPPSPLSTRAQGTVEAAIRQRTKRSPVMLPVLSMLDRRRALHRDIAAEHPDWPTIPLASAVEQCAVQQQPVGAFAPASAATTAFGQLWTRIERELAA
ncbi:chromosome partitioning protein ParA [Croceibacterium mercuriale]|uniref:Chromosome partitioning protein ParA n=1 Tax=Croceibacterium mercuriale TaxID=1572751 RepID=A0A0B2BTE3_9SPHN|nr:ParA family protein [Croceibacterium mercuriale]KHL24694.1 chromosome partitioning protein ParA [Croceibacterium mercuriale]